MRNEFLWVEKYRPKTIVLYSPDSIKQSFSDFLTKGEIPNLLLCGTSGAIKTTVTSRSVKNWDAITLSLTDPMKEDFWTQYGIKQRLCFDRLSF